MTNADGDLSKYREIAVVLGGGLEDDGRPNSVTLARAEAAVRLARERDVAIIVSGSHGDGPKPTRTEAEWMAEMLHAADVAESRIFIEDRSRDTVANAAEVAERYLAGMTPRRLIVVTSPFHLARALALFAFVLGPSWPLEGYPSAVAEHDEARAANETSYLAHARALLEGIEAGDLAAIAACLRVTLSQRVSDGPRHGGS